MAECDLPNDERPDSRLDARLDSWPAHVAMAVASGAVTTYLPVHRWRQPARWTLHGGMGAMAVVAAGATLANRQRTVPLDTQDAPPFAMGPAAKVAAVAGLGVLVAASSRGGESADAWVERALARRGVRRPRLWMGVAAAGASLAMSASDKRRAEREDLDARPSSG